MTTSIERGPKSIIDNASVEKFADANATYLKQRERLYAGLPPGGRSGEFPGPRQVENKFRPGGISARPEVALA